MREASNLNGRENENRLKKKELRKKNHSILYLLREKLNYYEI